MIFAIEKSMNDLGDKLTAEDKAKLEEELKVAKEELNSGDDDRIAKATERLTNESQQIFAKVYQQAQGAEAGPEGTNGTEGQAN